LPTSFGSFVELFYDILDVNSTLQVFTGSLLIEQNKDIIDCSIEIKNIPSTKLDGINSTL
jgi:hypothetical protein